MKFYQFVILILFSNIAQSSIYINSKNKAIPWPSIEIKDVEDAKKGEHHIPKIKTSGLKYVNNQNDATDALRAKYKAKVLQKARTREDRLNHGRDLPAAQMKGDPTIGKEYYHMDAVLNQLKRRFAKNARRVYSSSSSKESSSNDERDWKEEFQDMWLQKKFEAINSSIPKIRGDTVNMIAARPWGVPCGDPNQHDMPWGSCMLAMECDAEYRIYRGDFLCGRTQYVCCSLQVSSYDMYQGFDVSFADTSFSTDSEEKRERERGSKENRKRKKNREKKRRMKERRRRKRKIRKIITKIVNEIRKILSRAFRNSSHHRKKKTKLLKKFIKDLKKQYKNDRKAVREIHLEDMDRVDIKLLKKLYQIRDLNRNFFRNATFRDIVVNGTINKKGARMLVEAYPELTPYLHDKLSRRSGGGEVDNKDGKERNDYLEYDIEYGELYY